MGISTREVGSGPEEGGGHIGPEAMRGIPKTCSCKRDAAFFFRQAADEGSPFPAGLALWHRRPGRPGEARGRPSCAQLRALHGGAQFEALAGMHHSDDARVQRWTCLRRRLGGRAAAEPAPSLH